MDAWGENTLTGSVNRIALTVIAAISTIIAISSLSQPLVPLIVGVALLLFVALLLLKPRPLEFLFFLVPLCAPAIPAFTGLSRHYIVFSISWTVLFLAYWWIQSASGGWRQKCIATPFIYPILVYTIIFTISLFSHPFHTNALKYSTQIFTLILVYWLLSQALSRQNLLRLIWAVIFGCVAASAAFLVGFSLGSVKYVLVGLVLGVLRPMVGDYSANFWAWAPMVGWAFAMALIVHGSLSRPLRYLLVSGIFVMFISAFLCNSRSALLAMALSTIFATFTHPKAKKVFLLAVTTFLILLMSIPYGWMLMQSMFRVKMGLTGRTLLWNFTYDYIANSPVTGIGPGWYFDRIVVDAPPMANGIRMITGKLSAHNSYLMAATDLGVFSLLPILFIIGLFGYRSRKLWIRLKGRSEFPILVAICSMMIAGIARSFFETDFIYLHGYLSDSLVLLIVLTLQDRLYASEFATSLTSLKSR